MTSLILPRLTNPQKRIQGSNRRFNLGVWGRQSGKTTNAGFTMVKKPLNGPRLGHYWHILQTHAASEIAFNRYVRQFPKSSWSELWAKRPNESEKTVFLTGYREVTFKSGRNYDELRTETLHGAIIDECREQPIDLWPMVIRPMLAKYKGWCDFYSTPNGFDWFYDLHEFAIQNPDEWGVVHAPSTEAWWWTQEEIESARKNMTEAQFAQEILAEFRNLTSGKAYKSHGAHNWKDSNPFAPPGKKWSPYIPIIVGMDFNVNPMTWHLGQHKADKIWFGEQICIADTDSYEASLELVERVKDHNMGVLIIGDSSGKATSTKATKSVGKTDYDIILSVLKENKIRHENRTPESNPLVKDRVNTMNVRMRSYNGQDPDFTYSPKGCPELKSDFDRVIWKKGMTAQLDKSDPGRTHASDSVGYPTCELLPVKGVDEVGRMRIIPR